MCDHQSLVVADDQPRRVSWGWSGAMFRRSKGKVSHVCSIRRMTWHCPVREGFCVIPFFVLFPAHTPSHVGCTLGFRCWALGLTTATMTVVFIIIASFCGFCQTPAQCWGCELLAICLASAVVICQASRSAAATQLSMPSVVEHSSFTRATQADHSVPCPLFYCRMTLLPRMDPPRCLGVDRDQGCVVPLH